jgi:hypothetical protein
VKLFDQILELLPERPVETSALSVGDETAFDLLMPEIRALCDRVIASRVDAAYQSGFDNGWNVGQADGWNEGWHAGFLRGSDTKRPTNTHPRGH